MRFELLPAVWRRSRVQNDGEQATKQLIVNLYPFAVEAYFSVCRMIRE